jgi:hypothetical protein
MIREYLKRLEAILASYKWVKTVQVLRCDIIETEQEQILTYRFRLVLEGNGLLELMERVAIAKDEVESRTMAYRFHWQDRDGALIRRWDSAPHFTNVAGFPHHIHVGEGDMVEPGKPINCLEVLVEIDRVLSDAR